MTDEEVISWANALLNQVLVGLDDDVVCLTFAQSLNGCIASSDKKPLQISCKESMTVTHVLRRRFQAIMVGRNTLKSDAPKLTARGVPGDSQPIPIVVGRCASEDFVGKALLNHPAGPGIVVTNARGDADRVASLKALGLQVLELDQEASMPVDLKEAWRRLRADYGIKSVMVEGGAGIIESMLTSSLPNVVIITISPIMLDSTTRIAPHQVVALKPMSWQTFGTDVILAARMQ